MGNVDYLKGSRRKVKFEPSPVQLYIFLICGIIILITGVYLFITKTQVGSGSLPMHRYNNMNIRPPYVLNGTFTILLGTIMSVFSIYYIIKHNKNKSEEYIE